MIEILTTILVLTMSVLLIVLFVVSFVTILANIKMKGDLFFWRPYLVKRKVIQKINEVVKKDGWVVTILDAFTTKKHKHILTMYIKLDRLKESERYNNGNLSFSLINGYMRYDLNTKICKFEMYGSELSIKDIQL